MKAFHGNTSIKEEYLARIRAHRAADELARGIYWDGQRGCAVGCTLHDNNDTGTSVHSKFETVLGIPRVLAQLEDRIFESLPRKEEWAAWPEEFLAAIPVGADLSRVWPNLCIWILSDATHGTRRLCGPDGQAATDKVLEIYRKKAAGDEPGAAEIEEARRAADAAAAYAAAAYAYAAAYAAYAAAYAAAAYAAAAAAYAAAYAADAAAYAADAYAAARRAGGPSAQDTFWLALRDEFLRLLREAPMAPAPQGEETK